MAVEIKTDQESIDVLCKYCKKTPAEVPLIVERILREWYTRVPTQWLSQPNLIPDLPNIKKETAVGVDGETARKYKSAIFKINKALMKKQVPKFIHEDRLTSWLMTTFVKAFNMKRKGTAKYVPKW